MEWLKKNWLLAASLVGMAVCGMDVSAGINAGKTLLNASNLPSLLIGALASIYSGTKVWGMIPASTASSVVVPKQSTTSVTPDMAKIQYIFSVAESEDITDEMVANLAAIAAAAVVGHSERVHGKKGSV